MAPHRQDQECTEASTVMQNQRGLAFNVLLRANPEAVGLPRSPQENYPARSPPDHRSATQLSQHQENPHRNPGTAMMHRSTPAIASSLYVATQFPVNHAARQRYHHISHLLWLQSRGFRAPCRLLMQELRSIKKSCCVHPSAVIAAGLYLSGWELMCCC